jgi:uncharacterized membrane protein
MSAMPTTAERLRALAPRWLWIALIASLALNCLVLGIVFRSVWDIGHVQALDGDRASGGLGGYVATLSPERGKELREIYNAERPLLRPLRLELRRLRGELTQILETEPLDKERLQAAQSRILETEIEVRRIIGRSLADVAARMTLEERKAYLSWREERRRDAPRRRGGGDDRGSAGPPPKQP